MREWFDNHQEIEVLEDWPPNSPDLNPIENFWAATTRDWKSVFPRNRQNLENTITARWESYRGDTDYFKNLYDSMPRRLLEVIANGGGPTSY